MLGYILLLVVVMVLWYVVVPKMRKWRINRCIKQSAGGFDAPAKEAYTGINSIPRLDAEDHYNRATLVRYNILAADTPNIREADLRAQIEADYMMALDLVGAADVALHDRIAQQANEIIPVAAESKKAARVRRSNQKASRNKQTAIKSLSAAQTFTNDNQNVHDSSVNIDLQNALAKLADTNKDYINEASELIGKLERAKQDRASRALETISANNYISTFSVGERNLFNRVWARSLVSENADNRENIQDSIIDALVDCVGPSGDLVCINGRCSRMINALAVIDYDKSISGAATYEAYRNELFEKTKKIVEEHVEKGLANGDPEAIEYDNALGERTSSFRRALRASIDNVAAEYRKHMSSSNFDVAIAQCYIYADVD